MPHIHSHTFSLDTLIRDKLHPSKESLVHVLTHSDFKKIFLFYNKLPMVSFPYFSFSSPGLTCSLLPLPVLPHGFLPFFLPYLPLSFFHKYIPKTPWVLGSMTEAMYIFIKIEPLFPRTSAQSRRTDQ